MNLDFPRPGDVIAGSMPAGPEWYRWLQRLRASLGWDRAHPIWGELAPQITAWTGATVGTLRNGQNDSITGVVLLPNSYRPGSSLYPFAVIVGSSGTEAVAELELTSRLTTVGAALGATDSDPATPTVGDEVQVVEFDEIEAESANPNDVLELTLERAAVDAYAGDVRLLAFGAKYRVYGSGQENRFP